MTRTTPHHPSLSRDPADLIAGQWTPLASSGAPAIESHNPARPGEILWRGEPRAEHVDRAVHAARDAFKVWSRWPKEERAAVLRTLAKLFNDNIDRITALLRDEVGKPTWDARGEAQILAGKIDITLDDGPMSRVAGFEAPLGPTKAGRCWFRPHGVMGVVGPFNFPAHLPNGHVVPALAMGNTVVIKPSDKTPGVGQLMGELYHQALAQHNAPPGVVNVVQGGSEIASRLTRHPHIDGILFTGSWPVGRRILEANLDHPGRIIALEMGGNNAAVIMPGADLAQAVVECVRCAFISSGQRCTCTRRVIVHESIADRVISAICKAASNLIVGDPAAEHPVFMGPLISEQARDAVLAAQSAMARAGASVLVQSTRMDRDGWFCTPSVVQVDGFSTATDLAQDPGADFEVFGPLLRVCIARDFEHALELANASNYGLAASIFSRDPDAVDDFLRLARAGCVNVNTGTAGASSKLPFGGLGFSGNHRPAGAFSLDYCAYPVAGMIESGSASTISPGMRFEPDWVA
ncbi:MAG: aldehyde dehydrogenase family protein [Planctomycetota bacterium]|nr:aldehyde dehydrogenase family protein [Planctomycetota bacterium]